MTERSHHHFLQPRACAGRYNPSFCTVNARCIHAADATAKCQILLFGFRVHSCAGQIMAAMIPRHMWPHQCWIQQYCTPVLLSLSSHKANGLTAYQLWLTVCTGLDQQTTSKSRQRKPGREAALAAEWAWLRDISPTDESWLHFAMFSAYQAKVRGLLHSPTRVQLSACNDLVY